MYGCGLEAKGGSTPERGGRIQASYGVCSHLPPVLLLFSRKIPLQTRKAGGVAHRSAVISWCEPVQPRRISSSLGPIGTLGLE